MCGVMAWLGLRLMLGVMIMGYVGYGVSVTG